MNLSSDIVSQFVKITNDTTTNNTSKEKIIYGTIKTSAFGKYVQIDGSDQLTPVTTTADVEDGDRVTLVISNHKAIVTGNLSSPSATVTSVQNSANKITELEVVVADVVSTERFEAEVARVDALVAKNVTIEDELSAHDGRITNLNTKVVTVENELIAAQGDIDNLTTSKLDAGVAEITYATIEDLDAAEADIYNLEVTYGNFEVLSTNRFSAIESDIQLLNAGKLDADEASITYATISDLNAATADINSLEADVGDINTLIFGSATGDTIQTSFANAVIAQLGNAQIKSAMIKSLSASKITSGDIITNNVRVKSEDGSLLISDETMQISDDTRVRVQIGKDASDDYSINIWDADGNLMFSKGGITDSAIKDAIICNDMVSDTANIAAHKLDIDSLFEEINGSTNTIKSTQIYLDDEAQTLDVAFESITTDIEELQNGLSSQGTQITAIQGQIATKVWQSDIDTASDTLSVQYSTLEQEVDSISATVASHTSTLSDKADAVDVTSVSDRVTVLETDLDGFQISVSSTYATKEEVNTSLSGYSTTSEMNAAIEVSANEITSSVSTTYATKDEVDEVQSGTDLVETRVTTAESLIEQLSDCIAVLVRDANGESLMTQTEDGWTFSTANIQETINTTSENLNSLTNEVGDVNSTISVLQQAVDDLGLLNDYVKIGTYEDEPCIELGENDSDFKLIITNTRIMFMEGSGLPAYINNQSLHIKKAVVEEELQQGEFVWKVRSNGNLGLIWKGVTS